MDHNQWLEELKAQLEDHDNLWILMQTDSGDGYVEITDVHYDSEQDAVIMKVA